MELEDPVVLVVPDEVHTFIERPVRKAWERETGLLAGGVAPRRAAPRGLLSLSRALPWPHGRTAGGGPAQLLWTCVQPGHTAVVATRQQWGSNQPSLSSPRGQAPCHPGLLCLPTPTSPPGATPAAPFQITWGWPGPAWPPWFNTLAEGCLLGAA